MATMQAQPGTPAAFEASVRAANPAENSSIEAALKYQEWATQLGIGFAGLVVLQTNATAGPDDEFTVPQVQQMGINQQSPIFIHGVGNGTQRYNVGLELLRIAGADGETSYIRIYAIRNPGSTVGEAMAALTELDIIKLPMQAKLNALKKTAGLF